MSNVIGSGVIEVSADSRKLTAGIDEAKRSLKSLGIAAGDATKGQSQSIDRYVKSLGQAAITAGKTGRELELYKLALRGANAEQMKAADSALRMAEGYAKGEQIGRNIKTGLLAIGTVAVGGLIAAYAAFDRLTKKAGEFQDMAEKTGDTAQNIASLAVAAGTAGTSMETIVSASAKMTKGLTGVDDESKAAGSAIAALGLNIENFKALAPADQMEAVAKALAGFKDGAQKTAVAMALFGKSGAELLPFLKELGQEGGRQVILTQAQIVQADAYADKQAKLRTELGLHAQAIASQMVPAYNLLSESLIDVAKEMLGVQNGIAGMTKGDAIKNFAQDGAILLANIADVAYDVAGAFRFVGDNLGAMAAIAMANARLDFAGAIAIGAASDEQNARILKGLGLADRVQAKIDAMNARGPAPSIGRSGRDAYDANHPALSFNGVDPTAKDTAGKEAKARLGLDIETIKSASSQLIGVYTNAEKIMEALHSAGLIEEHDYYASKLEFLMLNGKAQEKGLEDEIARMEKEVLIGAARLNNEKKIAETRAKLATVKAGNSSGVTVLGIQSEAASTKRTSEVDDFFAKAQEDAKNRSIANAEGIRQSLLTQVQAEIEGHKSQIDRITAYNELKLEAESEGNARIEAENQRHAEVINGIHLAAGQSVLSIAQSSADQLYSALQAAGMDQTALGKTLLLASKAVQVASILINSEVAAAAVETAMITAAATAAAFAGPAAPGIIAAGAASGAAYATAVRTMGYISAGLVAGMAIKDASALEGYDIPEGINPVVQTHAKEMILPRAQANVIRDLAKDGGTGGYGNAPTIINQTTGRVDKVTYATLSNGERALILQEASSLAESKIDANMLNPNSRTSKAIQDGFGLQRRR